jgi:hypothetical protein
MKSKLISSVTAAVLVSAFIPTPSWASSAGQERKECERKCGDYTTQTLACYKKCDTKPDSKDKTTK